MEDEQVRQALDRGCDRRSVGDVLGISRRTTFNRENRPRAYGFPLDAYYNRGGRPTISATDTGHDTETDSDTTPTSDRALAGEPTGDADGDDDGADESIAGRDAQQRLDAVGQQRVMRQRRRCPQRRRRSGCWCGDKC